LQMPGMSGVDAIRSIRAGNPTVPIAVLTMFETNDYVRSALDAGASGYLIKDSSPAAFCEAAALLAHGTRDLVAIPHPSADGAATGLRSINRKADGTGFSTRPVGRVRTYLPPSLAQGPRDSRGTRLRVRPSVGLSTGSVGSAVHSGRASRQARGGRVSARNHPEVSARAASLARQPRRLTGCRG